MFIVHLWWWFQYVTGTSNVSGRPYGFFSGFGSDLTEITVITGLIGWYIHNQCHVDGCRRLGKHPFQHYKLCRKHHPDIPDKITHLHILKLHKEAK